MLRPLPTTGSPSYPTTDSLRAAPPRFWTQYFVFAAFACSMVVPGATVRAQDSDQKKRTEIIPTKDDKSSAAAKASDIPDQSNRPDSQFRKADSPSGLQLGLAEAAVVGDLPEDLKEFARKGALASAAKKWPEARKAFADMVEAAPDNALALANLGMVEYRLERYESARTHLRESLDIQPGVAHHWLALALCHYRMEDRDQALSCLFRARHEDEADPRVHLYIAVIARDYGWLIAAEKELRRAVALDPAYADAHFNLALLYLEQAPPAIELARRHYYAALDLGAKPDADIQAALK